MSDLISRQAVNTLVDELARAISDERCFMSRGRSTGEIMSDILNLPSVENKEEWIPVSERLPVLRGRYKISDDVLITNGFEIDMGYLVERTGKIFWHYYGSDYEVGIKDEDNDVIAWQPLPSPWKGE